MNPYRADKISQHPDRILQLCRGEHPMPVHVQLIIADLCNQSCGFCAYRMDGYSSNELFFIRGVDGEILSRNPARFIPLGKALEILEDCEALGVKAIEITGGGEPTVHSDHVRIFEAVRAHRLDLGLVTNGVSLHPDAIPSLAAPGAETWVRVSIDAGTAATYARLRQCPEKHWEKAWRTVDRLVAARERTLCSPLLIGISFVVTADNWREVVWATELARTSGVNHLRISGLFQSAGAEYFAPFREEAMRLCAEAEAMATEEFAVINMLPERLHDLGQGSPEYRTCGIQRLSTYIGADLHVYRCCVLAYNHRGMIGSLRERRFADAWKALGHDKEFLGLNARKCPPCQYNSRNRGIATACANARHGNFV